MRSHANAAAAPSTHRENATFSLGVLAAMLVCAAAFLGIGAPAAGAATPGLSYSYQGDIGSGGLSGLASNSVFNVVAVSNDDGNVFLMRQFDENGHGGFEVLDSDGNSITQEAYETILPGAIGVSADGSAVYMTNGYPGPEIRKFVSDGGSPPTYTEDPAWAPAATLSQNTGIAVDPTTDEVVVASGGVIYRFDSESGALLSSFDGSSTPQGKFPSGVGDIAVAPNGDVYITLLGRAVHMGSDGSWKGDLDLLAPNSSAIPEGIAVDPQSGDVAVELPPGADSNDPLIRIYSSAHDLEQTIRVPEALAPDNRSLAFSPDGSKLYVALSLGTAHVFARGTQPGIDPPVVSQLTTTGMHLTAEVATGNEATEARLEYCLATDPCGRYLGSEGSSPWKRLTEYTGLTDPQEEIADDLTGLAPNTGYLIRTYAKNEGNQVENVSAPTAVTTLVQAPLVTTGPASDVVDTSARLAGSVDNTFGAQTTYHFEFGLTTSYGSELPAGTEAIAGNLRTPRTFTKVATGLQPGTTYHYRLVASNSGGTTAGDDRTFTTLSVDQVAPRRGYEQVTVNKKGLALQPNWGYQVSPDGSAIEFAGTAPSPDSPSAAATSRYIARRGSSDWLEQEPLDPPFGPADAIVNSVTLAVSSDFQHTVAVSQAALTPDATEGFANVYVRDLDTGAYHLVGTAKEAGAFIPMTGLLRQNVFVAGAPDFSWVVLIPANRLLPGAPQTAMYKWTKGEGLEVLSLLPGDTIPTEKSLQQSTQRTSNRFVADDGDTAVFSLVGAEAGVYLRSNGETVAVSVSQASGGPSGTQPGFADGISRDGRFVIFHSPSQLTDADDDEAVSMYRYDAESGELLYLARQDNTLDGTVDVLGIGDDGKTVYFNSGGELVAWRDGQPGVDVVYPASLRGATYGYPSPNGRFFEFFAGDGAVHLYDAASGEETCLSCKADGSPAAGRLPGPDRNISNRLSQVVTDDGHAYFDSPVPLVGADRNGAYDVYEYYQGRLTLISPGARDFTATLVDISPDGNDVFFTTAEGLVARDTDQSYDVYDARVGGGFAAQNPVPVAPPCAGEACQGSGGPPPPASTPGSARTGGSGTPKQTGRGRCPKGTHKVRRNGKTRCVKKQSKHNSKKRDAKHNRGANR